MFIYASKAGGLIYRFELNDNLGWIVFFPLYYVSAKQ